MLKTVAFIIAIAASQASACTIALRSSDKAVVSAISEHGWAFENYDAICEKLAKANAEFVIAGQTSILSERAIAWASVTLKDKRTMIVTNEFGGGNTSTNENTKLPKSLFLAHAINNAINNMNIEMAIDSLNKHRRHAKQVLASQ